MFDWRVSMKVSAASNCASAAAVALFWLWGPSAHAQDRSCSNASYYANDLGKRADASFAAGDCSLGLSQLHAVVGEWQLISTLGDCTAEQKDAALANLASTKRRISAQSTRCPANMDWKQDVSDPDKTRSCDRELATATDAHLRAISLARDHDCSTAVPLFESTEKTLTELASRKTCSAEAHRTAQAGMHRIQFDLSILRKRYCVDGASKK
jgi:hypothetical protein